MKDDDCLDEVLLQKVLAEVLPDNRLPTIDELIAALRDPSPKHNLLLDYLKRRPGLKCFLQECL